MRRPAESFIKEYINYYIVKKVIQVTGTKTLNDGAKRLYDEDVTSSSSTFDIFRPFGLSILSRILKGIGITIDKGIAATGLDNYLPKGEQGAQAADAYNTSLKMPAGYGMAMVRQKTPVNRDNIVRFYSDNEIASMYRRAG